MSRPLTLVVFDWDGTLTERSTVEHIALMREAARPQFERCAALYIADLAAAERAWHLPRAERHSLAEELAWLDDGLTPVEETSVGRLESAGVWRGVRGSPLRTPQSASAVPPVDHCEPSSPADTSSTVDLEQHALATAHSLPPLLRPGAQKLLARLHTHEDTAAAVVSVAFSGTWVSRVLGEVLQADGVKCSSAQEEHEPQETHTMLVYANEIDPAGSGRLSRGLPCGSSSKAGGPNTHGADSNVADDSADFETHGFNFGGRGRGLWTASDKAAALERAVRRELNAARRPRDACRVVYVGDADTDLACLLAADVGVVMCGPAPGSSATRDLLDTLDRLYIPYRPIRKMRRRDLDIEESDARATGEFAEAWRRGLWVAEDLESIADALEV